MAKRWIPAGAPALALVVLGSLVGPIGVAQPPAPVDFCAVYPDAPTCATGQASCTTCHTSPPTLNAYGLDVAAHLAPDQARPLTGAQFSAGLPDALAAVEGLDADLDAYTNLEELTAGTDPADATDTPSELPCENLDPDGRWDLCGYDAGYAFKRVMIDFCGRSPTFDESQAFQAAADAHQALHDQLDVCLQSEHWRGIGGQVYHLANAKIRPIAAVKSGADAGPIPLADYDDDYAFWLWANTGDRDVRQVLTGQQFVQASRVGGVTQLTTFDREPLADVLTRGYERAQLVTSSRRAGMITHRWFLMSNTMFTAVPRTTAAQAYRAYLGYDISRLEGLSPVVDEPVDYDSKGVDRPECAVCHTTLDPLTYPFSRYEGIGGGSGLPFSYSANRMSGFVGTDGALVADTPEAGVLMGQPVDDLIEWAQVAADSEAFRRKVVFDYWKLLVGEAPRPGDQQAFAQLVADLGVTHGYRVELMLHDLIDTEAYGAP